MDLTLWIQAQLFCTAWNPRKHTHSKKPKTQAVSKKKKTKQNKIYITENEYKKINKSNIMYKINYSYYSYISFLLANKTKKKKSTPTIVKHGAQI